MELPDRQQQYARAIIYASNKELVFDYLKDQIAIGQLYAAGRQPSPLLSYDEAVCDFRDWLLDQVPARA